MNPSRQEYDYVIVGGGTAACVAAWRLLRECDARVLILEAGTWPTGRILKLPAGAGRVASGDRYITQFSTIPQEQLGGRVQTIPQARVLGGGSSINGQVYMRGRAADYDGWARLTGSPLWSWESLLPRFVRLENNQKFNNAFHGIRGPQVVSDPAFVCEASHYFVKAAQGAGVEYNPDFNRGSPAGAGYLQMTINAGRRHSAVDGFIEPIRSDPRLRIVTGARVTRILVEHGRASGVEFLVGNERRTARAEAEVLLAAGAFASPQLLMLSGIGPAAHLKEVGIPVVADLKGVGANLQDHTGAPVVAAAHGRLGYFQQDKGLRFMANGLEYLLFGRGRISTLGVEACSFHVPEDGTGDPVIQIYCVPTTRYVDESVLSLPYVDGLALHAVLLRPRARGWVRLASADPKAPPLVHPNYLGHPDDLRHLREGLRVARRILRTAPLTDVVTEEIAPGSDAMDDDALDSHLRRTVKTDYHPAGTCRMGAPDDEEAVVTPDLRVRGIERLRVIDSSIMPVLVSANTNAATMVIADAAVSLMRGEAPPGRHETSGIEARTAREPAV